MASPALDLDRGLPASPEAERSILGGVLLDNEQWSEVCVGIASHEFFLDSHCEIFAAMAELVAENSVIDTVTLTVRLLARKRLDAVGGAGYLASLTDGVPRRSSLKHYIRIVKEKAKLRELLHAGNAIAAQALASDAKSDALLAWAGESLLNIQADTSEEPDLRTQVLDVVATMQEERTCQRDLLGMSLAIPGLDETTGGLRAGEVMVIGALPERAKTAYALQIARANALRGDGVLFWSLEMAGDPVIRRCLASMSGVHPSKLRNPQWWSDEKRDQERIEEAAAKLASLPLELRTRQMRVEKLIAYSRMAARRGTQQGRAMKLMIIDHLTALAFYANGRDTREKINYTIEALRQFAREEKVALIVLHHLARDLKKDVNAIPNVQWLKESGSIEAAANIVLLPHRPEDNGVFTGYDDIFIGKMRDGVKGPVHVTFNERTLEYEPDLRPRQGGAQ